MVDLLAASRRPLQRLLHDCSFSEWENISLFLDGGATEAVRWAGGLGFILEELGISQVLDLQAFAPGVGGAERVRGSERTSRGIFLITTFVWDVEGAVLNAAKIYGLTEVAVACSVSEEAHACHPHAAHISEETGGRVSFEDVSQQLNISLVRILKIEAQSSSAGRRYRSAAEAENMTDSVDLFVDKAPYSAPHASEVLVAVFHSPMHVGCFLQAAASPNTETDKVTLAAREGNCHCSAFTLASPACARVFPLRRCDLEGGGGGGVGAALFAAAATGGGMGTRGAGMKSDGGMMQLSAEDVPNEERRRYRLLAHSLSEVLWDQLLLDVSGGGGVFTLGGTSYLIGATLAAAAEECRRKSNMGLDGSSAVTFDSRGDGGGNTAGINATRSSTKRRREASVVVLDRTLDLAAAASRGGSLLQRVLSSLPRAGSDTSSDASSGSNDNAKYDGSSSQCGSRHRQWSPLASAHQHEVGVILPSLTPGLGSPSWVSVEEAGKSDEIVVDPANAQGSGGEDLGMPRLEAMKALAGFSWPVPPSLCHSLEMATAGGGRLVRSMAFLGEEEGQEALLAALERCIDQNGCVHPPRKRRGMGSSIMALVTSLARGNPRPGGRTGDQVCFRCRGVIQVALAAMEAHQRTSALAGSRWAETVASERVQRQELRDGSTAQVVMEQLSATLEASSSALASSTLVGGGGAASDALLLALRGVSLSGGSIGAEAAKSFRTAWVSYMLAGGFREAGSGVPPGLRARLEQYLRSRKEGGDGEDDEGDLGLRLELEDIARERMQRLREAVVSREHVKTPELRHLGYQPYTFVAKTSTPATPAGSVVGAGEDSEWDDWGEDEASGGNTEGARGEATAECDTLVGRLAGLLLDKSKPELTDLQEAKVLSATSVGLGLLSSGLKKFARIGGAVGREAGVGGRSGRGRAKSRPTDRPVVVIFVVGGFTPTELKEVNGILGCCAASEEHNVPEVILAGTTLSTPDMAYEHVFGRAPACQQ